MNNFDDLIVGNAPSEEHTRSLLEETTKILEHQTESVVRHYVENSDSLDIPLDICEVMLRIAFATRKLTQASKTRMYYQPEFQYWLKAARRCSNSNYASERNRILKQFPSVTWATIGSEGKLSDSLPIPLDSLGGLRCTPFGSFIEFGSEYANQESNVTVKDDTVTVYIDEKINKNIKFKYLKEPGTTNFDKLTNPERLTGGIQLSARDDFLCANYTGTNQRHNGVDFFGIARHQYEAKPDLNTYNLAMQAVQKSWPEGFNDLCTFTVVALPRKGNPKNHICFTVSSRQGAIYLDPLEPLELAENIVHETAHVKLRCMQLFDPIILETENDQRRFAVAWRKDKRPLTGILEGCYVFTHVAQLVTSFLEAGYETPYSNLSKLKVDISNAIEILENNAKFTKKGTEFLSNLKEWNRTIFS